MTRRLARITAGLLALALAACGGAPAASGPKNILLVTLDTTRADHLGFQGYFRDTTPRLDALAAESIVFERALAPMSTTLPSHISIFTGTYPIEHGAMANLAFGGAPFAPSPGLQTFAAVCREAGYQTAAFVSAAPLKAHSGIQLGFTTFDEPAGDATHRLGEATTDAALAWLEAASEPYLLWVHYYDAHWPLLPGPEFTALFQADAALEAYVAERRIAPQAYRENVGLEKTLPTLDAYDAELRYQDVQLGRLLDAVRERGEWERTVIVVVGDHGEGLAQHGHAAHGGTWDEQLHTPLVLRVPGEAPRRHRLPVSLVDTIPTLLARLDAPRPREFLAQMSGRDALAPGSTPQPVFSQDTGRLEGRPGYRYALTTPRWKYFRIEDEGALAGERLFDLASDPFELRDVAAEHPAELETLRSALQQELARQRAHRRGGAPSGQPADPELVEQLRALGYADEPDEDGH